MSVAGHHAADAALAEIATRFQAEGVTPACAIVYCLEQEEEEAGTLMSAGLTDTGLLACLMGLATYVAERKGLDAAPIQMALSILSSEAGE